MRAEASDRSEMVSQMLFGETCTITDENEKWFKVRTHADDYTGWIDKKQLQLTTQSNDQNRSTLTIDIDHTYTAHTQLGTVNLFCGSKIGYIENAFYIGDEHVTIPNLSATITLLDKESMLQKALSYLNTPYLWGGRTSAGIDCSGYVQLLYKLMGIALPRDASQQVAVGNTIDLENTQSGDLAFFKNIEGRVVHVGLMLDNTRIIHASGRVRIDMLDNSGIYNIETQTHSHTLHSIKRIIV